MVIALMQSAGMSEHPKHPLWMFALRNNDPREILTRGGDYGGTNVHRRTDL